MSEFYYVTAMTGEKHIVEAGQYALKSLLLFVDPSDVHCIVNTKKDVPIIKKLVKDIRNLYVLNEDLSRYKWKYMKGRRKYAVLKSAGIHKVFPNPIPNKYLVLFDSDVLWYQKPDEFLSSKKDKTWFHHGKALEKRAKIKRELVKVDDFSTMSKWCRKSFAYLLVKYKANILPEREINSGFYILHPRDHGPLHALSYKGCRIVSNKFIRDDSCGEQCPLNAALYKLRVDWHGGSRWMDLGHENYFEHFFGDKDWKAKFRKKVKQMSL